jgi:small subunit ribosomal protein S8
MDPISNMIIQIKNAGMMKKESVVLTYSNLKMAILECLEKAGFVAGVTKKGRKVVKFIEVKLAYEDNSMGQKVPKISDVKRVSKGSKRVYMQAKDIRPVKSGYGVMVMSTPKGIMTGSDAKKAQVGGEALFQAW